MQIENSVFLVTGAGSGLGAATARMVVSAGGRVLIADVNRQGGEGLAAELGANACFAHTDVTDEASAQAAVDLAVARFGTVHCLVTCAGIAPAEKVVGRDGPHRLESFIRVVQVNLIGVFNMLRLAAVVMNGNEPNAEGERGVIINTASISAFEGQIGQAAYGACRPRYRSRWAKWSRFRPGWANPRNSPRWSATSPRMVTSTAKSSVSTARSAWGPSNIELRCCT